MSSARESGGAGMALALQAEQILEDIEDGFIGLDRQWRIFYVNRAAEQFLRKDRANLIGHDILQCAGTFRPSLESAGRRAMETNDTVTLEEYVEPLSAWYELRLCPSPRGLSLYFRDVTARKQIEGELRASEERYRLVTRVTDDAIYDWDLERRHLHWSEGMQHVFGYRTEDIGTDIGWWEQRIHPDDRIRVSDSLDAARRGKADTWAEEYRFRRRDLSYASIIDRAYIIRDEAGLAVRMVGAMIDISRLKQTERTLEDRNRFLQKLVATVPSLIMTLDARGRIVQFNRACEQLTGYRRGEVLGQDMGELLLEERSAIDLRRRIADPYAANVHAPHEVRWRMKNGELRLIAWQWTALHPPDGLTLYMLGTGIDVTEQRRAEEALRRSHEELERRVEERTSKLREANERLRLEVAERARRELELRTVMSHARCILWHADIEGLPGWEDERRTLEERFVWNAHVQDPEAASRILPLDPPPGYPYLAAWINSRVHEDAVRINAYAAEALSRGVSSYSQEYRCVDRYGQIHWLFEDVFLEPTGVGRWHAVGVCTDITDRKRGEQEREEMAREQARHIEIEAANRAKDQFLAVLSHELRTPLNPVLLTATALLDDPSLPPHLREDVEVVRRNIELQARLIDDLLDLTRISRGKLNFHFAPTDVHALLRSAIDVCLTDIEGKRLRCTMDLAALRHHVNADAAHLQQAFWNLLKNALKFTPPGGEIIIRSSNADGGAVRIEVEDSGIGISPDALPKIFVPFGQADESITRRFGGLGLGLTVAKEVVEAHGGTITARSEGPGSGATFTITLPSVNDPAPADAPSGPAGPARTVRPLRILLVEDHEDTLNFMVRFLSSRRHQVTSARSVQGALDAAERGEFDLIISDIGLPDGSGLDLMPRLREHHDWPGIALSGYGMEEDLHRSRAAGFIRHLIKPIDSRALEQAIQETTTEAGLQTPDG